MKIYFATTKLEKILTNERLLRKRYGNLTNKIMARLTDLRTAENLKEITHLPPPRRHKLSGYKNIFAVDVSGNYRIIFSSIDENIIELEEIDEIVILDIVDYH